MGRPAKAKTKKTRVSSKMAEIQKSLRANSDITAFYSFLHENDLRFEAKALLQTVIASGKKSKTAKILQ